MKCLIVVDPQNDFLPGGAFDVPDDYINVLHKINSIRLKLFGCSENDLIKVQRDPKSSVYACNKNEHLNYAKYLKHITEDSIEKRTGKDIKEYHECKNYIEDVNSIDELYMFPFDNKRSPIYANDDFTSKRKEEKHKGNRNNTLCNNHECIEEHYDNDVEKHHTFQNEIKEKTNPYGFSLHIVTMDCHSPLNISLAETHRMCYEKICKNKWNKNRTNSHETNNHETNSDKKKTENTDKVGINNCIQHSANNKCTEICEIKNLSDVLNNLERIHHIQNIYPYVNSINDIKEFEKLTFLNETIDMWPVHCIENYRGYYIHKNFIRHWNDLIVQKGVNVNKTGYSLFENEETSEQLLRILKKINIKKVYLCGFVLEYCVQMQALDFSKMGFETIIIEDATAYLGDKEKSINNVKNLGTKLISSQDIFNED